MIVVHKGFDTITLAIQANIPQELFETLDAEREEAEEAREARPFEYGGADFDLLPYGGNGYRFILKGGPLDAHWFFKKPNSRDPWGIRVTLGSTLLATQGLGHARAYIENTLTRLGVRFAAHQVSIARADFCVDVLAPDLELIPENFVMHSHSNRDEHFSPDEHVRSNGKSGRYTSVTVGKMPGRQVIVYDKRREVIDRHKPIWWDIWNSRLTALGHTPLDPKDPASSRVWRVEIRAAKNLLKDRWQIRQWAEFDNLFGDVIAEALQKVRYCEPDPSDTNRARWPNNPLWDLVGEAANDDLVEMRSYLEPNVIKTIHREEHIRMIFGQALGLVTTLAALEDVGEKDLQTFIEGAGPSMWEAAKDDLGRAYRKLADARARYRLT
ncbi:MAG: hypothetical protein HUJ27_01000 [Rhodobacteraceae bacterium]|nr:hypothetical protein [Paracoccaceae bacterium]